MEVATSTCASSDAGKISAHGPQALLTNHADQRRVRMAGKCAGYQGHARSFGMLLPARLLLTARHQLKEHEL
jgi:hypothetical protein